MTKIETLVYSLCLITDLFDAPLTMDDGVWPLPVKIYEICIPIIAHTKAIMSI